MDEQAAVDWLRNNLNVSRETEGRLELFVDLLRKESVRQNLVSALSLDAVFARHVVDSAQIVSHCSQVDGVWLDLGSGAGFPGVILSILTGKPITLVEPRALRAHWLRRAADALKLENVRIEAQRIENVDPFPAAIITARAFAPLDRLLNLAYRFSTPATQWVLPKGRSATEELASVADTWHGVFTLVPSVTDPSSAIIIGRDVRPRTMGTRR